MRRTLRIGVVAGACGGLLVAAFSCSKKPTRHEPTGYLLYAGAFKSGDSSAVMVIDAESDSVIDSIAYAGIYFVVHASPDGKYLGVYGGDYNTRIYDVNGLSLLTEFELRLQPVFFPRYKLILGASNAWKMHFYDYSSFAALGSDTLGLYDVRPVANSDLVSGLLLQDPPGSGDSTWFALYDYRERAVFRLWTRLERPDGGNYRYVSRYDIHPDGRRIYGVCVVDVPPFARVFCYDLTGDSAVFEFPVCSWHAWARVDPTGRELYITDPGPPWGDFCPARISVLDAGTGALLDQISLEDLDSTESRPRPFYAADIRFHPTQPKAYVASWYMKGLQPILVIDTRTRQIIKRIFPLFNYGVASIDIGPKPQSGR